MPVPAHNSNVGTYSIGDVESNRSYGQIYSPTTGQMEPFDYINRTFWRESAWCRKGNTEKSDRYHPTNYHRWVFRLYEDSPFLVHSKWVNPVDQLTSNYDYIEEEHISRLHAPFSYVPWYDWYEIYDNARREADVKALNSLAADKASLGADLATARQTVDMFATAAGRGARFLLNLKRGNWRALNGMLGSKQTIARDAGKTPASLWLEYQYGWAPLAGSIYDTEKVARQELVKDRIVTGKGFATWENSREFEHGNLEWKASTKGKHFTRLNAKLEHPDLHRLDSLGLVNPLTIAWEVVPWSFAIDWFVPVGATLEALSATFGLSWDTGYRGRTFESDISAHHVGGKLDDWSTVISPGSYLEREFRFDREILWNFPRAEFYADTTPFSTVRVANALALVRQLFK